MGKHAAINKKSNNSNNPDRPTNGKGCVCFHLSNIYYFLVYTIIGRGLRSKSTIMRLNMYKGGKPVRTKEGKIIGGLYMSKDKVTNYVGASMGRFFQRLTIKGRWKRASKYGKDST